MDAIRIGIDLGGSKIEAAALDAAGRVLVRRRVETPRGSYSAILASIVRLVDELEREIPIEPPARPTVGVSMPGSVSPHSGRVVNANTTELNGRCFDRDLASGLKRPVRVCNDANCLLESELRDGAGVGAEVVFGVILGTGVGGAVAARGRVLAGVNRIAGEWGHNPLPWLEQDEFPGPPCWCGRRGCVETWLSGPALTADHARIAGVDMDARTIAAAASAGDALAEGSLRRFEDRLARALAAVINLIDPDVIVLGGGLSRIARLYRNVPQSWSAYAFSERVRTRLEPARHGDASGVRGAAWLWGGHR